MAVAVGASPFIGGEFLREAGTIQMGEECQDGPFYNVDNRTRKAMLRSLAVLQKVRADNSLHKVADRVYLSSLSGAMNLDELRHHGITHILCVASGIRPLYSDHFKYKSADILDSESQSLLDILPSCLSWMVEAHREDPKNVILVHCFAGRSRSVGVLLGYFMFVKKIPLRLAFTHLRRLRPQCNPNNGFMRQLAAFEKEMSNNEEKVYISRGSEFIGRENLENNLEYIVGRAKERLRFMEMEQLMSSPRPLPVRSADFSFVKEATMNERKVEPCTSSRSKIRMVGRRIFRALVTVGGLTVLTFTAAGHHHY